MIKKTAILSILLIACAALASKAQLANTRWSGTMNVPAETNVVLEFKADTLLLNITDMGIVGETMSYSVKDSVITLKKISGNSPCDLAVVFTLKYKINNNQLFISTLNDPCEERKNAWPKDAFYKK